MPTLPELVEQYYTHRGYVTPKTDEALLFLVSEVGELCEAYLSLYRPRSFSTRMFLNLVSRIGRTADGIVSGKAAWVRNGDRKKTASAAYEIGDVQMMLTVVAGSLELEPVGCMLDKMASKGFVYRSDAD